MTAPTIQRPRLNSAFQRLMSVHWWMAACYLLLFIGGTGMARMPRIPIRNSLYDVHKSIGVLTLALLSWRIITLLQVVWKKYTRRAPRLSAPWMKNLALHTLLYLFMWAVPVAGFLLSNSYKSNNVAFFGITVPDLFPENAAMVELGRSLHFWLAYAFLTFIVLHVIVQWKVVRANGRRFRGFVMRRPGPAGN
jgi:cytochrome b561